VGFSFPKSFDFDGDSIHTNGHPPSLITPTGTLILRK